MGKHGCPKYAANMMEDENMAESPSPEPCETDTMEETGNSPSPEPAEKEDMMSMFASVWVKVEVDERDDKGVSLPLDDSAPEGTRRTTKRSKKFKNDLICDQCDYRTTYKNCLEMHILGHSQEKAFSCSHCDYKSKYPTALQRHMAIRHQETNGETPMDNGKPLTLHKCPDCDYSTFYKWNLNSHKRKHKLIKQFKCPFAECNFETAYRHNYIKHSKVHKEAVSFKCDKCPFQTRFEGHITRHLAKIHNEITEKANKCDLCDFSTKTKWRLKIHQNRMRKNDPVKCQYCDYESFYMCAYKKHKVQHYNEIYINPKRKTCFGPDREICTLEELQDRAMISNLADDQAMSSLHDKVSEIAKNFENYFNKEIQCLPNNDVPDDQNKNNQEGENRNNYQKGLENENKYNQESSEYNKNAESSEVHKNQEGSENQKYKLDPDCVDWNSIQVLETDDKDRPFQCHMCAYTSKFKASVQRHFQRHHTGSHNRPYKCVNCDFSTKTKDQIALHNKRSQSDAILTCDICKFTTLFKCQYVMHQKCHYAYKCSACNYSCKHKYELQRHYGIMHLGNGIKCRFCEYKASRKDSVLCHETIHTGVKPFKCEHCDYTSIRKSLLDNHVKRYHSDIKKDITIVSESKIQSLKVPMAFKKLVQDDQDESKFD